MQAKETRGHVECNKLNSNKKPFASSASVWRAMSVMKEPLHKRAFILMNENKGPRLIDQSYTRANITELKWICKGFNKLFHNLVAKPLGGLMVGTQTHLDIQRCAEDFVGIADWADAKASPRMAEFCA